MKQVVQNFKSGVVQVLEVPKPVLKPGFVLVKNRASLISAGTEGGTVKLGKMNLLGKVRARPEQVKKVLQALRTEGILATAQAVRRTLDIPVPLGYSCAGFVEAVSDEVAELSVGTPVACGGAGMALHAEYVVVPRNLCVPIPAAIPFEHAAFTTVGAIALQSVRIADARLGENVVVIGLGLVGLILTQILKAGGCRVFGIDVNPKRVKWVEAKGICAAAWRNSTDIFDRVLDFSGGYGADVVIITAAAPSNDPVTLAGELSRFKGRIVVVGRTKMEVPRETYLFKELALCTSYAYGPGAEDSSYEIEGYDYPLGYVRWTEKRNMACFLELLGENKIDIAPLITHTFRIEKGPSAFDLIADPEEHTIGVVLEYGERSEVMRPVTKTLKAVSSTSANRGLRIGILGAGSFATNVMLPLLSKRKDSYIKGIVSASGLRAAALAEKYRIEACAAEAAAIIDDPDIDCIFIFTRHGTHATFAQKALLADKHVFVEKPLALDEESLRAVISAQELTGKALMVGFNRSFSPLAQKQKDFFKERCQPMVVTFRGNVGYRPREHWLHDPVDGGGVILGEACHYIEYCRWMVGSPIISVEASCVGGTTTKMIPEDNAQILLRFTDGSIGDILYLSNGARGFSRERCEIHTATRSAVWEDFRYVKLVKDLKRPKTFRSRFSANKGYSAELDMFFEAVRNGSSINAWSARQLDASWAAIKAAKTIGSN